MTVTVQQLVGIFPSLRVLILGDVMLDRFVYGQASRLSPEGPIPVLTIERETVMAGGAANVACNVASLGGVAVLIGLIGDDEPGREFAAVLCKERGVETDLVVSTSRHTTTKMRLLAGRQHLLRADIDDCRLSETDVAALLARFSKHLPECDVVVLSDYAKGVLSPKMLREAIGIARAAKKTILADPKFPDMRIYDGVTIVTPNAGEARATTGIAVKSDVAAEEAARSILNSAPALDGVLITRSADGMSFMMRNGEVGHIPTAAREVNDVSGAGDTVMATLALSLAAGASIAMAARAANLAAGVAVSKVGTAKVLPEELYSADQGTRVHSTEAKIFPFRQLLEQVEVWRARGEKIGFTNGCFDLVHPGHVSLLACARAQCDRLVVGLNSDASVKRLKGSARPVQDEVARAIVLASLANVDAVTLFDTDTPLELIRALRPEVLIKGADYRVDQIVGAEDVQAYGGRVHLVPLVSGQSTTQTIEKLVRSKECS